jgi:hypothetical protein
MNAFDTIRDLQARWHELDPYDRHDFSVQAVKLASEQGAEIPDEIRGYGGEKFSARFEERMKQRATEWTADPDLASEYARLGKVAGILPPEEVVALLYALDDHAGLLHKYGSRLPDPLLCVYEAAEKVAGWSWTHGDLHVTEDQLHHFALANNKKEMYRLFEDAFVDRFRMKPVEEFKKQGIEKQIILARMALQSGNSNDGGVHT